MENNDSCENGAGYRVVGVGASAGGLDAFFRLLSGLPTDSGFSYVLIQHLDATHPSHLTDLLAKATSIPVITITDAIEMEADRIYIGPPGMFVSVEDRRLNLRPLHNTDPQRLRPINVFFNSLAEQFGERAIGIVLSGTGEDGTLGLQAIKEGGGITYSQESSSAQFIDMPLNAAALGVDYSLPPEEIAASVGNIASGNTDWERDLIESRKDWSKDAGIENIINMLRPSRGTNFLNYKRGTIERRIQRRMVMRKMETLEEYSQYLSENPDEIEKLGDDILIKVTNFFRDPESFETLKNIVIPEILKLKPKDRPIRIWVPGCSSGEEAYSIAMVVIEALNMKFEENQIKIFATDISKSAIDKARAAVYPETISQNVNPERLNRFFIKTENGYQIKKYLRELCVFAEQDVVKDPPFSRIDLISCRNLLIYLKPSAQKSVIATFHFALEHSGFLLLSQSESVGTTDLFAVSDKAKRLYTKRLVPSPTPNFIASYVQEKKRNIKLTGPLWKSPPEESLRHAADIAIATNLNLNGVVIDNDMEILQFRGNTERYLVHRPDEQATFNIFKMAREGLLVDLRLAIHEAVTTDKPIRREGISEIAGLSQGGLDAIEVIPFKNNITGQAYYVVAFEQLKAGQELTPDEMPAGPYKLDQDKLRQELEETRQYLNSLLEIEQATNEELKSASEEILSSNEELQSTNEELQTAKEEAQSANEELRTVYEELRDRHHQLNQTHDDLVNIVRSADQPMLMVSGDLTCRYASPLAVSMLGVASSEPDLPIAELWKRLGMGAMPIELNQSVLNTELKEYEVQNQAGRWFNLRLRPYLKREGGVDGFTITFDDIDVLKRSLDRVTDIQTFSDAIIETVPVPLLVLDSSFCIVKVNQKYARVFELDADQCQGKSFFEVDNGMWDLAEVRTKIASILPEGQIFDGFPVHLDFKTAGTRVFSLTGRRLMQGNGKEEMILLAIVDVTVAAEATDRIESALQKAESASLFKSQFLANMSHEIRTPLTAILGFTELILADEVPPENADLIEKISRNAMVLAELVDDFLDLSKIESGKLDIKRKKMSLRSLLTEMNVSFSEMTEKKGLQFTFDFTTPVPESIISCPLRLRQIFTNVIGNAIKFTRRGSVKVAIELLNSGLLSVDVYDSGIGIAPETAKNLFQMFSQGDRTISRAFGGSGLGLALSQRLAHALGGDVKLIESAPDGGSQFNITIDPGHIVDSQMFASIEQVNTNAAKVGKGHFRPNEQAQGLHFLVADDNEDNKQVVGKYLSMSGATYNFASNGEEALEKARSGTYDGVLMDIYMPVLDGYSATKVLKKEGYAVPIIAFTAQAVAGEHERSLAAGCVDLLLKPINPQKMIDMLLKYCSKMA